MAKTSVVRSAGQDGRVPFLRGILTRSLQDAGLSFDKACALASTIRDELRQTVEISASELHDVVVRHLESDFSSSIAQRYDSPVDRDRMILIRDQDAQTTVFSRGQLRQRLESSGLSYEDSASVTSAIHQHMMKKGETEISARQLGLLTYRYLQRTFGDAQARRYLVLMEFLRGERPVILLIGGASGCGKSAVAMEITHRLEIARIQSTDLLREVMRMMIPERLMPVLHRSSFDAWRALPTRPSFKGDPDLVLEDGFRAQAELLTVPCEAVIRRSLREQSSLILEGVHVQHELMEKISAENSAVFVHVMLAILNPNRFRERISRRGDHAIHRRAERYLENFDSIWRLQSFLLSEADRAGIPIILNHNKEQVIAELMRTIVDQLASGSTAKPENVFV